MGRLMLLLAWLVASAPAAAHGYDGYNGYGGYPGRYPPQPRQVTCESWKFQPASCPADTRGGVRLIQQTGGVCTRGQTWGFTQHGLWVNNGCRAIFAATGGRPGAGGHFEAGPGGRLIMCESWRFRPARCAAHIGRRPQVEVIAGNCSQGRTWGWDQRGVWVDGGCRARFRLG